MVMEESPGVGWVYDGPAASRLWEKSALGSMIEGGKLRLSDSEALFCNIHRGIDLPETTEDLEHSDWIAQRIRINPTLLLETTILESLRVPGNKVVLSKNAEPLGFEESGSWGLRWSSDTHPTNDSPVSEVLWFQSKDKLYTSGQAADNVLRGLLHWCNSVSNKDRIAEVLVIDDELSVVTYRIQEAEPKGKLAAPNSNTFREISEMQSYSDDWQGSFYPEVSDWPCESIGIPSFGGRQLDIIESELVHAQVLGINVSYSENNETSKARDSLSQSASILLDLWNRGLNTRSGFKYGTTWRCYPGDVGDGHAPWLVVDPTTEGPTNWAEACLSSRLASGVNKQWLYPIFVDGRWRYLEIFRPPSDSRWSNPTRR